METTMDITEYLAKPKKKKPRRNILHAIPDDNMKKSKPEYRIILTPKQKKVMRSA